MVALLMRRRLKQLAQRMGAWDDVVFQDRYTALRLDLAGIDPPVIREGTVGADARALGAAAIPLSQRYLIDQNVAVREG